MKKVLLVLLAFSLQACPFYWTEPPMPESEYKPVFMERDEFEASVLIKDNQTINDAGKIYIYDNYLFINDKYDGFAVFDNENPENPIDLKFINAPGATDMAIKNNVVYINQAVDLIAVELSTDMNSINVSKRIRDIFPVMLSPDGYYPTIPEGKVLVNWIKK